MEQWKCFVIPFHSQISLCAHWNSQEMVSSSQNKIHGGQENVFVIPFHSQCLCVLQHRWLSKHTTDDFNWNSLEMVSSLQNKSHGGLTEWFCFIGLLQGMWRLNFYNNTVSASAAAIVWLFAKMYMYAQQQELQQPLHKINLWVLENFCTQLFFFMLDLDFFPPLLQILYLHKVQCAIEKLIYAPKEMRTNSRFSGQKRNVANFAFWQREEEENFAASSIGLDFFSPSPDSIK